MDPRTRGFSESQNGFELDNQKFVAGFRFQNATVDPRFNDFLFLEPDPTPTRTMTSSITAHEDEGNEDCDFSDAVLRYINKMLMEEDMEEKTCTLQDSLELQDTEKSLYEVIGKKYPPSPKIELNYEVPDNISSRNYSNYSSSDSGAYLVDNNNNSWNYNIPIDYNTSQAQNHVLYSNLQTSFSSSNSGISNIDGLLDSPDSIIQVSDLYHDSQSAWHFMKGVEEANKFLPTGNDLFFKMEINGLLNQNQELKVGTDESIIKVEIKDEVENGSRGKKNLHKENAELEEEEERSSKMAAIYTDSTSRSEMFDEVLLCLGNKVESPMSIFRSLLQTAAVQNRQTKGYNGKKGRGKKNERIEVVDLRTLLISCAQAVAADDRRSANELLKQVKLHSSPFGDGNQRLAHCFVDGFEARLAGTGSQRYKGLISKRTSATDILKAFKLYIAACPFRKMSHFVSNRSIMNLSANSTKLHIIDFGILYGFQWPTFIHRLSTRPGGPPKLRITGIDFPQPGFRPSEMVEETGRRLADYAKMFDVPFEYNSIAKKWETIQIEELKIEKDEILIVNSLYRFKNLQDESVSVDSSRNTVLNLIRKLNPDLFIHGIVNGSYNAPFFVTRFREALFHFSAIFDMLETIVPREDAERMLIERDIFGKEALNVVACEGWERVERPETYKQWQVRNLRAGFRQVPFDGKIMKVAKDRVKSDYHKDFVIDEDSQWFLQGWKGRIIYALSIWKPV